MYRIKTKNSISPAALSSLNLPLYTVDDEQENPHGILVRSSKILPEDLGEDLLAIVRAGAGYNNVPVEDCTKKGIVAFNTPGANANAVKELTIAALISGCRNLSEGVIWAKTLKGKGDEVPALVEKGKSRFVGPEIGGKKLGVIGLGAIGVLVANAAVHLGMEVYGYDPFISIQAAWNLSRSVKPCVNLADIISDCDFLTLHLPVNKDTEGFVNKSLLEKMKDGVRIINLARGDLAVNADIISALSSGKLGGYITDFPTDELIDVPGVMAIPHLGASTPESEDNCAFMAVKQLKSYLINGEIINSVNMPNVSLEPFTGTRICIFNKNQTGMLSAITGCASEVGINIDNLVNKSRKDIAYTVLDVAERVEDDVIKHIEAIDGVIRVRALHSS